MPSEDATPTAHGSSPTRPMPVAGETRIGKYLRHHLLGRGGMGAVYLGYDTELKRPIALKFLAAGDSPEDVQRFLIEAQTAAKLRHPNIAAVYDTGQAAGEHFIAMEYVDGGTIDKAKLPQARILAVIRDVALAVHYANTEGIVHRDLKPANLMVDKAGRVFVMDFGLARMTKASSRLSVSGTMVGTPGFMPPEQAEGRMDVDARADVYSLGATLYALLTGRPPFVGEGPIDTALKVLEEEPVPPRRINPRIPADIQTIILKAMEKDRDRRYQSAAAFAEDLRRFHDGEPIHARPASVIYRMRKRLAKHRVITAVVAAAGLLIVALALLGTRHWSTNRQFALAGAFWATHLRAAEYIEWGEDRGGYATPEQSRRKAEELNRVLTSVEEAHGKTGVSAAYRAWFRFLTRAGDALGELDALCAAAPDEPFAPLCRARCRLWQLMQGYHPATIEMASEGPVTVELNRLAWPADAIARIQADARTAAASPLWAQLREGRKLGDLCRAIELVAGGRPADARAILDEIVTDPACGSEARRMRAIAFLYDRDFESCAEALEDAARASRHSFTLWRNAALARVGQAAGVGDPRPALRRAIDNADRAVDHAPDLHASWSLRGLLRRFYAEQIEKFGEDPVPFLLAAADDYERALLLNQRNPELLRGAGSVAGNLADIDFANRTGWLEKAIDAATRALAATPDDPVALNNRGDALRRLAKGGSVDARRALADFDRALTLNESPAIRANRALCRIDLGDAAGAIQDCDTALAKHPGHARLLMVRASARTENREFAAALADLDAAIQASPRYAPALNNRAEVHRLMAAGAADPEAHFKAAVEDATNALGCSPRYLHAMLARAMARGDWGFWKTRRGRDATADFVEAQKDFSRATELAPRDALAWATRGTFYLQVAQIKLAIGEDPIPALRGAIEDLAVALEIQPGQRLARANRATAHAMLGEAAENRGEDALRHYRAALPDFDRLVAEAADRQTLLNRAEVCRKIAILERAAGNDARDLLRRAISDADAVLKQAPSEARAHQGRIEGLEELAKAEVTLRLDSTATWEAAMNAADDFVRAHPKNYEPYRVRANLFKSIAALARSRAVDARPSIREALKDWDAAVRLEPRSAVLFSNRADAWRDLAAEEKARGGEWKTASAKAIADYRAALELAPSLWQACANIAVVHDDAGNAQEAVTWMERAIKLNPSHPALKERLKKLKAKLE